MCAVAGFFSLKSPSHSPAYPTLSHFSPLWGLGQGGGSPDPILCPSPRTKDTFWRPRQFSCEHPLHPNPASASCSTRTPARARAGSLGWLCAPAVSPSSAPLPHPSPDEGSRASREHPLPRLGKALGTTAPGHRPIRPGLPGVIVPCVGWRWPGRAPMSLSRGSESIGAAPRCPVLGHQGHRGLHYWGARSKTSTACPVPSLQIRIKRPQVRAPSQPALQP